MLIDTANMMQGFRAPVLCKISRVSKRYGDQESASQDDPVFQAHPIRSPPRHDTRKAFRHPRFSCLYNNPAQTVSHTQVCQSLVKPTPLPQVALVKLRVHTAHDISVHPLCGRLQTAAVADLVCFSALSYIPSCNPVDLCPASLSLSLPSLES